MRGAGLKKTLADFTNAIIHPVEFTTYISEVEFRLSLKEICGSYWDDRPFRGEVEQNSFWLIKNRSPFKITRGYCPPILRGEFAQRGDKTHVRISLEMRIFEWVGYVILLLTELLFTGFTFISMLKEGLIVAAMVAAMFVWFFCAVFVLDYFITKIRFRRAVHKLKSSLFVKE